MKTVFLVMLSLVIAINLGYAATIYLDADVTIAQGSQDGTSKSTAYDSLTQEIIDTINPGDTIYLWGTFASGEDSLDLSGIGSSGNVTEFRAMAENTIIDVGTWIGNTEFFVNTTSYIDFRGLIFTGDNGDGTLFQALNNVNFYGCTISANSNEDIKYLCPTLTNSTLKYCSLFRIEFPYTSDWTEIENCTFINCRYPGFGSGNIEKFNRNIIFQSGWSGIGDLDTFSDATADYNILDSSMVDSDDVENLGSHSKFMYIADVLNDTAVENTDIYSTIDITVPYDSPAIRLWDYIIGSKLYYSIRTY